MQGTISLLVIFVIFLNEITSLPIEENASKTKISMLDAILLKCPKLKQNEKFINPDILKTCSDWVNINATDRLSATTKDNVPCLLYYDSITNFCHILNDKQTETEAEILPMNLTKIKENKYFCENLTTLLKNNKFEHELKKLLPTTSSCIKVCYNFDDSITDLCASSYYYASFVKTQNEPNTNQNVDKHSQNSNSELQIADNREVESKQHSGSPPVLQNVKPHDSDLNSQSGVINQADLHSDNIKNNSTKSGIQSNPVNSNTQEVSEPIKLNSQSNSENTSKIKQEDVKAENKPNSKPDVTDHSQDSLKEQISNELSNKIAQNPPTDKNVSKISTTNGNTDETGPLKVKENISGNKSSDKNQLAAAISQTNVETGENIENPNGNNDSEDGIPPDEQEMVDLLEMENGGEAPPETIQKGGAAEEDPSDKKILKPSTLDDEPGNYSSTDDLNDDSYFLSYFTVIACFFFIGYVGYHNRQKILALLLEGKKGRRQQRGRRPNSANYSRLDSNLEEALTSSCNKNTSHVIY